MTTKHQPATPLPWTSELLAAVDQQDTSADKRRVLIANIEFSIHAANAYPRLVEALRANVGDCEFDVLNPCFNARPSDVVGKHWGVGSACGCCHAHALLRELGEEA